MSTQIRHRARGSIRPRLLGLLIGLITLSIVAVAYLSVSSILRAGETARQASGESLRNQIQEYLVRLTSNSAERTDLVLERVYQDAGNVAHYAASILEHPEAFAREKNWRAQDHMLVGQDGQYTNGPQDTTTVFVPNTVKRDDKLIAELEMTAYLDPLFATVLESNPNTVAIYIVTQREIARLYPNINLGGMLPPDYSATQDIFFSSGAPAKNPSRSVVWTEVYDDPAGQGLLVTAVAPIYTSKGDFLGIIGIDVSLAKLAASIESTSLVRGGYSFLINDKGRAIALPQEGYRDILKRQPKPGEFGTDLLAESQEFKPILRQMATRSTGFESLQVGQEELFVAYAPLPGAGWSLATVLRAEDALSAVSVLQKNLAASTQSLVVGGILPFGALILVIAIVVSLWNINRLVAPIQKLAAAAQEIGAGKWDTPLPPVSNDEIGTLTQTLGAMSSQLRELVQGLEQRVVERTRELAQHSNYLEATGRVAREASATLDVTTLLPRVANLISEQFGFYHTGIFLIDASGEWAELKAASSQGGKRMLERGHRLRVEDRGIVGYAANRGQARIALDTGADAVFLHNPDLPDTHSEMALPLQARGRIIGALDVQSTVSQAFGDEDVAVLQTLADQVALAISNARLFQESQESIETAQRAYGELSRQAWTRLLGQAALGFVSDRKGLSPVGSAWEPEMKEAMQKGQATIASGDAQALAIPIRVRGQVIGVMDVQRPSGAGQWTPEQIAMLQTLTEQLSVALESARLYQDTQRRAARERLTREITDNIRAATSVEDAVQRAVQEMSRALGAEMVARIGTEQELLATERGDGHE